MKGRPVLLKKTWKWLGGSEQNLEFWCHPH
jgi:hypothetical protein